MQGWSGEKWRWYCGQRRGKWLAFCHGKAQLDSGDSENEEQRKGNSQIPIIPHLLHLIIFPLCLATTTHALATAETQPVSPVPGTHLNDNATLVVKEEQPCELEMPCLQLLCLCLKCPLCIIYSEHIWGQLETNWRVSESECWEKWKNDIWKANTETFQPEEATAATDADITMTSIQGAGQSVSSREEDTSRGKKPTVQENRSAQAG